MFVGVDAKPTISGRCKRLDNWLLRVVELGEVVRCNAGVFYQGNGSAFGRTV